MKMYISNYNCDIHHLRQVDFTSFLSTPVRKVNDKRVTLCPFHKEDRPSFYIFPDNTYHCFGCGAHGNAIDFMMKKFGYSFSHACSILEAL